MRTIKDNVRQPIQICLSGRSSITEPSKKQEKRSAEIDIETLRRENLFSNP